MAKEIKIQLVLDDKQIEAKILNADKLIDNLRKTSEKTTDTFKDWATITTGLNQGLQLARDVIGQIGDSVMKGAKLGVLRENFRGSAEDIELFRKATANTVSEANLIKLSNQATDLGVSLEDQAKLFALAEDAGDKYGVGVEEGFQRVVLATEGNIRGLKDLGIQKEIYEQTVNEMARAIGGEINQLDAETQKQIRLNAVLKLSGITMEDVKNKTQDNADKLEEFGVKIDEAETAMGKWISDTIVPFIDSTGTAGTSVLAIGSAATTIIPMLGSLRLALQGVNKSALGIASLVVSIGALLGLGAGKLIDYLKYDLPEEINEESKKAADELNKAPDFLSGNKRFVPGTGVVTITNEPVKPVTPIIPGTTPGKTSQKKLEPGELPLPVADDEIIAMVEENMLELEEIYNSEIERMADLNNLKWEYFEEEKMMQEEQQFIDEMIYYSREELLTKEIELEQQRFNIMKQLSSAENLAEVEDLKKQKSIVDKRIQNIKAEVQAREEQTKQMILAGSQQYDASVSLGKQMNQMANEAIRRIIAEAVATQIAKVIAMIPWPFNLIAAPLAGLAVQAMIEKFIPKFATGGMINGKRHSSGGVMVNAEGGEYIVNRQSTRGNIELLEAINSARGSVALNGGSSIEVVRAINSLGNDIRQLQVIAKINPREFDEDFSNYTFKKNHTG